jgi:hypothetical protein
LVEVRAAQRRRALDEVEPVGQEHRRERPRRIDAALERGSVNAHALLLPRCESDLEHVRAVRRLDAQLDARELRPDPHQLALVRGAARARGEPHVERLEQVGLPGAVRAGHHVQPRPELDLRPLVVAEVPDRQPRDVHGYTLSRIGMTR